VTALGRQRVVSTFATTASIAASGEIEVLVHVTRFTHRGDVVVAVAVHPRVLDERGRIDTVLGALEHPAGG